MERGFFQITFYKPQPPTNPMRNPKFTSTVFRRGKAATLALALAFGVLQGTLAANPIDGAFPEGQLPADAPVPVDVYILAGQSNMSGRVNTGFTATPAVDGDILYYYRTDGPGGTDRTSGGKFTTLGTLNTGYYGPEISMARALHASSTNKLAIIKISKGGTSLQEHWNSRAGSGNTWWLNWVSETANAAAELEALGYAPVLKGICWLQGESDQSEPKASNYAGNFSNLIADMLAHLDGLMDIDGARFVTALIKRSGTGATKVRAAQVAVMDSVANWLWFDTMDLTLGADKAHFDEASNNTVGERFAEKFLLPPELAIASRQSGGFDLSAIGVVYSSDDLSLWNRMDPQPASTWISSFGPGTPMFYQARDR